MRILLILFSFTLVVHSISAQFSITSLDTDFTINFEGTISGVSNSTFTAAGFTTTPTSGQLDSDGFSITDFSDGDVAFGGTGTGADHTRGSSTGGVSTAGVYAFDIGSGDIIFGVQPNSSEFNNGSIRLALTNNTGSTVRTLNIAYNISYYNDQGRSSSLNFSYSPDNVTYYDQSSLDFATPETADGSPSWQTVARSISITGLSITNGSNYYLSWDGGENGGSGSRDEFGIDDIVVSMGSSNLDILITEVMYNPNSDDSSWEWIEVYNNSSSDIDMTSFVFDDDDATALSSSNISAGLLQAGTGIIIMDETSITQANFTSAWGSGISYATLASDWPGLGNTSDNIGIWTNLSRYNSRTFANALDEITYQNNTAGWPNDDGNASIYYNDGTFAADNNTGSNWTLSTSSGSTPVGTGFQSAINGTTNTGLDIGSPHGDTALPVVLTYFGAVNEENAVLLLWSTSSEINNSHFTIQRSHDGIKFEDIGRIIGNGTTNIPQNYEFTDVTNTNVNTFYRLKQVDFDGAFEYSKIVSPGIQNGNFSDLIVFPNPVQSTISFYANNNINTPISIQIYGSNGHVVYQERQDYNNGLISIPLSPSLTPGLYYIKTIQDNVIRRSKFIKNH